MVPAHVAGGGLRAIRQESLAKRGFLFPMMRSSGKGGMSCSARLCKSRTVQFEAMRLDGEERFRLEVRLFP